MLLKLNLPKTQVILSYRKCQLSEKYSNIKKFASSSVSVFLVIEIQYPGLKLMQHEYH